MPTVFGFSAATVVSGSMADEINVGDFIITKEQSAYREGDIITFSTMKARLTSPTGLFWFRATLTPRKGTQTTRRTLSAFRKKR